MLSKRVQRAIAPLVYEKMRLSLTLVNPAMRRWQALAKDEQDLFMKSIDVWVMGIGSNEVGDAWYERSGDIPKFLWDQLPGVEHRTIFAFAGIDVLFLLAQLADAGLAASEIQEGNTNEQQS